MSFDVFHLLALFLFVETHENNTDMDTLLPHFPTLTFVVYFNFVVQCCCEFRASYASTKSRAQDTHKEVLMISVHWPSSNLCDCGASSRVVKTKKMKKKKCTPQGRELRGES